ncbi:hypothetical protein T459_16125 [Capsicum annuum]|uniref:Uncharacterized protein n=1 Tax=Capsicum annuum TaxID=4072 RepID=A0A2G2Z7T6_CAPAN|nr:hypothetical protein FXO37_19191 [Capsicum annuum]PHT78073.1 hypothetical protein T459_16125 [Capsicum annuum]
MPAEIEDIILQKILLVSIVGSMENDTRIVDLEMMAAEILRKEPLFQYVVNCYCRALEEGKKISLMKDKNMRESMDFFKLGNGEFECVSVDFRGFKFYGCIYGGSNSRGVTIPPGFLDELHKDGNFDSMDLILKCQVLVNHPWWIPKGVYLNRRFVEMTSIVGPLYRSFLPDDLKLMETYSILLEDNTDGTCPAYGVQTRSSVTTQFGQPKHYTVLMTPKDHKLTHD